MIIVLIDWLTTSTQANLEVTQKGRKREIRNGAKVFFPQLHLMNINDFFFVVACASIFLLQKI